jgi:hypothetical protein
VEHVVQRRRGGAPHGTPNGQRSFLVSQHHHHGLFLLHRFKHKQQIKIVLYLINIFYVCLSQQDKADM